MGHNYNKISLQASLYSQNRGKIIFKKLTEMTTMSIRVVVLASLIFLDSLDSPLLMLTLLLQLSNRSLFRSASFIARNNRKFRITRDTQGIKCTNKTLNLKIIIESLFHHSYQSFSINNLLIWKAYCKTWWSKKSSKFHLVGKRRLARSSHWRHGRFYVILKKSDWRQGKSGFHLPNVN